MSAIDPLLGEYVERAEFAKMVNRSPRTISRWMCQPNGLPHLPFGKQVLISIPLAREWLQSKIIRQPNRRKAA